MICFWGRQPECSSFFKRDTMQRLIDEHEAMRTQSQLSTVEPLNFGIVVAKVELKLNGRSGAGMNNVLAVILRAAEEVA